MFSLLHPGRGAAYCDQFFCLSVCLSVPKIGSCMYLHMRYTDQVKSSKVTAVGGITVDASPSTLRRKKWTTQLMVITLSTPNRFSKFFHPRKADQIVNKTYKDILPHLKYVAALPVDSQSSNLRQVAHQMDTQSSCYGVRRHLKTWPLGPHLCPSGEEDQRQLLPSYHHQLGGPLFGKGARQYRCRKLTFLQIRNSNNRCQKAKEQLICKWKLSLEWIFTSALFVQRELTEKLGALGGDIFKTQRNNDITTVRSNKWRPLVNEDTSGATYGMSKEPSSISQKSKKLQINNSALKYTNKNHHKPRLHHAEMTHLCSNADIRNDIRQPKTTLYKARAKLVSAVTLRGHWSRGVQTERKLGMSLSANLLLKSQTRRLVLTTLAGGTECRRLMQLAAGKFSVFDNRRYTTIAPSIIASLSTTAVYFLYKYHIY